MALSLTAEQKELLKILKIEEQYIVPAYQRPYSWEYDQCFQLYNDLTDAFHTSKTLDEKEDYFIGNIIIARSNSHKEILEVIDGQQRLTTLLLIIKVLSIFHSELKVLTQILEQEDWTGEQSKPRIKSEVFETNDELDLGRILHFSKDDFEKRFKECLDNKENFDEKKCLDRFETNILYFYNWFSSFKEHYDLNLFITYLLKKVYLLPIEIRGETKEKAKEKALIIFETINNRGMNLEDADIFKAKLFKRAEKVNETDIFIDLWKEFKHRCENLKIDIDDIFRYYSHIIRGQEGITSSEIKLREFFTTKDYSPFKLKKYKEIMDDLNYIMDILEFIHIEKQKVSTLAKWLQLIEAYTNKYPKFALVTYLFINGYKKEDRDRLNKFLESVIRYAYYNGSTTKIKFEIYVMIKKICSSEELESYYKTVTSDYFDYLGNLKYGYTLLALYISHKKSVENYTVDKIVSLKDKKELGWSSEELESYVNSLGNFIVLDIPKKRYTTLQKKLTYYQESKLCGNDIELLSTLNFKAFQKRDKHLKNQLVSFFKGT
jgi:uncharacterized protein with ParB-like and HNH nuclease domain